MTTATPTPTTEQTTEELVVIISRGLDDERATVGWTLANGAVAEGLDVTVFLVSAGVDLVRTGAADLVRMNPLDPPMGELIAKFMVDGGTVLACPPCTSIRGYDTDDLIDGVQVAGAPALYARVKRGAATISV